MTVERPLDQEPGGFGIAIPWLVPCLASRPARIWAGVWPALLPCITSRVTSRQSVQVAAWLVQVVLSPLSALM